MFSVRSAIISATLLFLIALTASIIGMMRVPDSGGLGRDSFGTRAIGYRGLFETLGELDIPIQREFQPPDAEKLGDSTLVLLGPDPSVVGFEPSYLTALIPWVENGGRVVLAAGPKDFQLCESVAAQGTQPPTVLEALGIDNAEVVYVGTDPEQSMTRRVRRDRNRSAEDVAREILSEFSGRELTVDEVDVSRNGQFADTLKNVQRIDIPSESMLALAFDDWSLNEDDSSETEPEAAGADNSSDVDQRLQSGRDAMNENDGEIFWENSEGDKNILAASFPRGDGEIVAISDPRIFANILLAEADNSVLAAALLSPDGRPVVIDEFYHGLGVRGSSLFLLTRLPYATVAIAILFVLVVWTWRSAIFLGPPLADTVVARRDISEYIRAMGQFFTVGGKSGSRLMRQVRDGVLRQISEEVGLPPDLNDPERIAAAVGRRDIRRGDDLLEATRAIDDALAKQRQFGDARTLEAMQRITACLSK